MSNYFSQIFAAKSSLKMLLRSSTDFFFISSSSPNTSKILNSKVLRNKLPRKITDKFFFSSQSIDRDRRKISFCVTSNAAVEIREGKKVRRTN